MTPPADPLRAALRDAYMDGYDAADTDMFDERSEAEEQANLVARSLSAALQQRARSEGCPGCGHIYDPDGCVSDDMTP